MGAVPPGETLLALQQLDAELDRLAASRATLPERVELRAVETEAAALERRWRELESQREQRGARERSLASSAGELGSRIAMIESQVAGGRVDYRDQGALAEEIASLARQRDELEEEELTELTELDGLEQEAERIAAARPVLRSRHRAAEAALAAAERSLEARLAAAAATRPPLADALPPALLNDYERLRAHLGGAAVARVVRGACSGCHLALPATEADRLRHAEAGTIAHCEHCGRILVV